MIQALVAALAICVLAAMCFRANRRFSGSIRLPMQWFLNGSVTWTAPRSVALAFIPVLGAIVLALTAASTIFLQARQGQEWLAVPVEIIVALVFVSAYALYLRLVAWSLGRGR